MVSENYLSLIMRQEAITKESLAMLGGTFFENYLAVILRRETITTKSLARLAPGYGLLYSEAFLSELRNASEYKSPPVSREGFLL